MWVGRLLVLLVEAQNKQKGKWSPPATKPSSVGFSCLHLSQARLKSQSNIPKNQSVLENCLLNLHLYTLSLFDSSPNDKKAEVESFRVLQNNWKDFLLNHEA